MLRSKQAPCSLQRCQPGQLRLCACADPRCQPMLHRLAEHDNGILTEHLALHLSFRSLAALARTSRTLRAALATSAALGSCPPARRAHLAAEGSSLVNQPSGQLLARQRQIAAALRQPPALTLLEQRVDEVFSPDHALSARCVLCHPGQPDQGSELHLDSQPAALHRATYALPGVQGRARALAFSPDGAHLVCPSGAV